MLSCVQLCYPMDCSPPISFVHGILQARILVCIALPFSRKSSQPRVQTGITCIVGGFLTSWATREDTWYQGRYESLVISLPGMPGKGYHMSQFYLCNYKWMRNLSYIKKINKGDFPVGPVVKNLCCHFRGHGFNS